MIEVGDDGDGERDCEAALRAIYVFLDREMPAGDRETIQGHLDDCLPCLEAFEFEAELRSMIANKCKEDVPEHLYERIRVSLEAEIIATSSSENSGEDGIPTS